MSFSGMISHHNLRVNLFASTSHGLPPNETTIAELAKDKGYSTAIIGQMYTYVIIIFGPRINVDCANSQHFHVY